MQLYLNVNRNDAFIILKDGILFKYIRLTFGLTTRDCKFEGKLLIFNGSEAKHIIFGEIKLYL